MNIVEIVLRTKSHLDSVRSPRFRNDKVIAAINTAIRDIVLERYDAIHSAEKQAGFQTSQRLRDELYTLVKTSTINTLTTLDDSILVPSGQFPADYWLLLSLTATISGKTIPVIPLTYDEWNVIELNPFTRPSIDYPEKAYRNENSDGIEVKFGPSGTMTKAKMYYLSEPDEVSLGTEKSSGNFHNGEAVICYMDGDVIDTGFTYSYKAGDEFTTNVSASVVSGIFYIDYVNTDLPTMLHEEIAKRAASLLSGTVENYDRVTDLDRRTESDAPQLGKKQ